jgi:hypothetical protein
VNLDRGSVSGQPPARPSAPSKNRNVFSLISVASLGQSLTVTDHLNPGALEYSALNSAEPTM